MRGESTCRATIQIPQVGVGADDGIRTRDPHLGKVVLYQLSHVRVVSLHANRARVHLQPASSNAGCHRTGPSSASGASSSSATMKPSSAAPV